MQDMTMVTKAGIAFAYLGGAIFFLLGVYLSYRRGRLHPLLLLCISAISISWIEAPYDWAVYAQFPPEIPRMPAWWPMNMTWGGLPLSVPPGYIAYFVLPAVIAVSVGRKLIAAYQWRAPQTLLATGLVAGCVWAFVFNAGLGAQMGVFYYGRVIGGLAIFEGTKQQYPLYDTLAMGIQMMLFTYLLGRTDSQGRSVIEWWADSRTSTKVGSGFLSIVAMIVIGHALYLGVYAPHLATKLMGLVTVGPTEQLFEGIPNQPL
jgi:hypothetical protein